MKKGFKLLKEDKVKFKELPYGQQDLINELSEIDNGTSGLKTMQVILMYTTGMMVMFYVFRSIIQTS